ncbi:MAG: carbohydrate kinase family protein [Caldilineaceae bacterium]
MTNNPSEPQPSCQVACVGILVADLFAPPLPRLPAAGELLKVEDFLLTTGGCAANTALDLHRLGVSTAVIGKVGEDSFGDFVIQDLSRHGLSTQGIRRSAQGTSRTVILPVVGEDRRYIHAVGANGDFTAADIDRRQVLAAQVLYVGGYMLLPRLQAEALADLFAEARQAGVKTVLDVAGVTTPAWDDLAQLLPHVDVFLPNHDEACILTGETDPVRQAAALLDLGAGIAGITLGGDGAYICTRTEQIRAGSYAVDVVDPSGGGDAFDAGFIVGMLEGWDLASTVEFASAAGALACTALGCTAGLRTRAETLSFVRSQPSILR